ncbi:MAG: hypothetical protein CMB80_01850 [Flammeovirgaceae bacterium]|nr:hypothetical protein [Flammeovirgaceae bacterium]|tara:strand:+ start:639 stop:842 length:204 start_codon:yes stop_codon:yes gene_type:complete
MVSEGLKLSDYMKYLNKEAFYRIQTGLEFEVMVVDVGNFYGNIRFKIKPLGKGTGSAWVQKESVKFI